MSNRTYYGLQTAGAFVSGMAEAYNRNLLMQADIKKYESQMAYQSRQEAFAREQFEFEKKHKTDALAIAAARGIGRSPNLQYKEIGGLPHTFDPSTGRIKGIGGFGKEDSSLKSIYGKYPQETKRTALDDTLSQQQMQIGFEQRVADLESQGMTTEEAESSAKRELGDLMAKDVGGFKAYPKGFIPKISSIGVAPSDKRIVAFNQYTGQEYAGDISEYITDLSPQDQKLAVDMWATTNTEEKKTIKDALKGGVSIQDIIEWMKKNVK